MINAMIFEKPKKKQITPYRTGPCLKKQ